MHFTLASDNKSILLLKQLLQRNLISETGAALLVRPHTEPQHDQQPGIVQLCVNAVQV